LLHFSSYLRETDFFSLNQTTNNFTLGHVWTWTKLLCDPVSYCLSAELWCLARFNLLSSTYVKQIITPSLRYLLTCQRLWRCTCSTYRLGRCLL